MALNRQDIRNILGIINDRLRSGQHESADHLDRGLYARKIKPGASLNILGTDSTLTAVWQSMSAWGLLTTSTGVEYSDVLMAQAMAEEAQKEAIDLDALMERKTEFEVSELADRMHNHDNYLGGCELNGGYAQITSSYTTGTINGARETVTGLSITVVGDGVHPVMVEAWVLSYYYSTLGTNPSDGRLEIWDGTVGGGTLLTSSQEYHQATSTPRTTPNIRRRVAAFTGEKIFQVGIFNSTPSNSVIVVQAGANFPAFIRATWV